MPTVQIEAQLSFDKLLEAASQLSLPDLERFSEQVLTLQARRKAPSLSKTEADLLLKINQGLPVEVRRRYATLMEKRQAETLSEDEYQELLNLTDQVEMKQAERIEALGQLAQLRGEPVQKMMKSLEISALV